MKAVKTTEGFQPVSINDRQEFDKISAGEIVEISIDSPVKMETHRMTMAIIEMFKQNTQNYNFGSGSDAQQFESAKFLIKFKIGHIKQHTVNGYIRTEGKSLKLKDLSHRKQVDIMHRIADFVSLDLKIEKEEIFNNWKHYVKRRGK